MTEHGVPHWTYADVDPKALLQGDILDRTPELVALLQEVHPHFARQIEYLQFIVLTQSCDLARRDGKSCGTPYIAIGAVRSLDDVVWNKEVARFGRDLAIGRCLSPKGRNRLHMLVERLLNNTEGEYFFLRANAHEGQGVGVDSCACLRVKAVLRSEHYDVLLGAKRAQLSAVFQAKIGWLIGNIYSRVGTPDWQSNKQTEQFRALVDGIEARGQYVSQELFTRASRAAKRAADGAYEDEFRRVIASPPDPPPSRVSLIEKAFQAVWVGEKPPDKARFWNKLKSDVDFVQATREERPE